MFKPNYQKLNWAINYLLNKKTLIASDLSKILFQAEIQHLNTYGRPITGISYFKSNHNISSSIIEKYFTNHNPFTQLIAPINTYYLSISDINCLELALVNYQTITDHYIVSLPNNSLIDYRHMISNPEILDYLNEVDPWTIVL